MFRVLLGVCLAAASAGALRAAGQQPPAPDLAVKVSTPIYLANGKTAGGSGTWPLRMNQSVVAYPNGGSTFCGPTDAAGWRVEITPVAQGTGTVLNLNWQHVSLAAASVGQQLVGEQLALTALEGSASGSARDLFNLMLARLKVRDTESRLAGLLKIAPMPSRGVTQVTLQPGDRMVLDYISTSPRTISPNMATEVSIVTGPPCDAVGMGLEVSLESTPKTPTVVETDLWLIHTHADKTEESQHQTLRVRAGDSVMYWFDPVLVQVSPATRIVPFSPDRVWSGQSGQPQPVAAVRVSGRLAPLELGDGKIHMKLTLARSGAGGSHNIGSQDPASISIEPPTAGSATYDLTAEPGEVLSFELPAIRGNGGYAPAGVLSVRVRAKILTSIPTTTTTTAPITLNQR